ncbi:MAG: lipoyl synthase [Spirochaetes bacterium]|nr:lipoyl synthase [Spirochaetota bacterium]
MRNARPVWLNKKIDFRAMHVMEERLAGLSLRTVCHQARCPNISECFCRGTATFLILGDICTRGCGFCSVKRGSPSQPDTGEPTRVAEAVRRLQLRHVVVTSVTRDDLADGGASLFATVIRAIREYDDSITVETLTPDFLGDANAVKTVVEARPDIFGHNLETVPSLYGVRTRCDYRRSLKVLESAKAYADRVRTKSAIMLGLGETEREVIDVFRDLRNAGCDYLAIGQYLQPDRRAVPVKEYLDPFRFVQYRKAAESLGFKHVESGVYVRSSYMADRYGESEISESRESENLISGIRI